jgi:class 3 adenylate cyclase/predicted ATPase
VQRPSEARRTATDRDSTQAGSTADDPWSAVEAGDWSRAAVLAERILSNDPSDPDAAAILRVAKRRFITPRAPQAGRRRLAVMFCDLVGSTSISSAVDPEVMHEIVLEYQRLCSDIIERYEGAVAEYRGDGILAFFGTPIAHEDDTKRSVLAALDIVEAIPQLGAGMGASHGIDLGVRIGIHPGEVVLGAVARTDRLLAFGEAPNVAARVQAVAPANAVVVSGAAKDVLEDEFDVKALGAFELKGIDRPVEIFRVLGTRDGKPRPTRMARPPLIGRQVESQILVAAWESTLGGRSPVVVMDGEPGIGKTRVVEEFRRQRVAPRGTELLLECSPFATATSLGPVRRLLHGLSGPSGDQSPVTVDRLEALAVATGVRDQNLRFLLANLLDTDATKETITAPLGPEEIRERTFAVLLSWVRRLAANAPVLVVVEDAQWADASTRELLQRVADDRVARLMLVMTTRSKAEVEVPSHAEWVHLEPLSPAERDVMIATLEPTLAPEVRRRVAERSDGVPLYIEQLARGLREDMATPMSVPSSLHELLQARLDQHADERRLLELLACIGEPAEVSLLADLEGSVPDAVERRLDALVAQGILRRDRSRMESAYAFEHGLLAERAYEMQLRRGRRETHRLIAEMLESRFVATGQHRPDVLARHFEEAGMVQRAIASWLDAGNAMIAVAAHREALHSLERALGVAARSPEGVPPETELEIQMAKGGVLLMLHGYSSEHVRATYQRAMELLSSVGGRSQRLKSLLGLWMYHSVRAEHATARPMAAEAHQIASDLGASDDLLVAANAVGYQATFEGRFSDAEDILADVASRSPIGAPPEAPLGEFAGAAWANLACVRWILGRPTEARTAIVRAVTIAESLGPPIGAFVQALVASFDCWYSELAGDLDRAASAVQRTRALALEHGFPTWLANSYLHEGMVQALGLDPEAGIATLGTWVEIVRAAGSELFVPYFLSGLSAASLVSGRPVDALAACDRAIAAATRTGEAFFLAELHRLRGEALTADPERSGNAVAEFEHAIDIAHEQGARAFELKALTSLYGLAGRPHVRARMAAALEAIADGANDPVVSAAHRLLTRR